VKRFNHSVCDVEVESRGGPWDALVLFSANRLGDRVCAGIAPRSIGHLRPYKELTVHLTF
jgi:hypothetical protein